MRLSEHQIKTTPAPLKRTSLSDGRGLELRMTPSGKRTWSLLYPYDGKKQRYTIGDYPAVRLKEARLLADKLRNQVAHGKNPQDLKRTARNANTVTVTWCYEQFLKSYLQPHLRTWKIYDRRLTVDVLPTLGNKDIRYVKKADIIKIIDGITDRNASILANRDDYEEARGAAHLLYGKVAKKLKAINEKINKACDEQQKACMKKFA
ncbi:Arm DNA-binding domain-containing protein [Alphaproteobacteria bacterium]|nr:Arm DNA-binding domain-containing protein [Alphaproteobacteria bacterium]